MHTETLDIKSYYTYLQFIDECRIKQYDLKLVLHNHHIIPKFIDNDIKYQKYTVKLSVQDHIQAHILLSKCFNDNSIERIGNLRSAKFLSKNSIEYRNEFKEIYKNQMGDNNPARNPVIQKKISDGLAKYYSENKNAKHGKTYEEIYGSNASLEKEKRKNNNRTKESYLIGAQKASLKLTGKQKGGDNPFAKKIEVNGVIFNSVTECLTTMKISRYKLHKYYNVKEIK
jgi:hypothetical protein